MKIHYKNTPTHYGLIAKILHWSSVFLLLSVIIIASSFEELENTDPSKQHLINQHVSIGLIFLLFMLTRFVWRQANPNPILSYQLKRWQKHTAISLHRFIYFIILIQCACGMLISLSGEELITLFETLAIKPVINTPWLFDLSKDVHQSIADLIYFVLAIHISAAIYHQIFGVTDD
jgi:cytochrome b561